MKIHIVQKGDTLWKIAKKYGVNFEELKKMNSQLSNPDMIMPGMKIKVPTSGGSVKKEGTINIGVKKEVPIAEHPFAKEKPKEMPIKAVPIKEVPKKEVPIKEMPIKEVPKKEVPIKEMPKKEVPIKEVPLKEVPKKEVPKKEVPIIKEAPKAPYTPKMPLQVVPEIDVSNYYMTNMANMTVQPEVPKKEIPIPAPLPVQEAPCEMPQEYCVPVTPVMPGPGFCPPFGGGGFPIPPMMPYSQGMAMAPPHGMIHGTPGVAPTVAGTSVMPGQFFHDESSSFMPQMPVVNPAYNPGAVMGAQSPVFQQPMMDSAGYGQMPAGYGQMPGAYSQMPTGYGEMPAGYGEMPAGYGEMPAGYGEMPTGYSQMPTSYSEVPAGYGQMPAGYSQMPTSYSEVPAGYG
ncbi:SafA/ExsA family spore coat assembly protein, partial [Neobacillus drentensis]